MKKPNNTKTYYTPYQLKMPVDMERIIKISDPVYTFSEVMAHIDLTKYFVAKDYRTGRPGYDRETLLKIVLFAFMEHGYCSLRQMEKLCETDIRFLWLLGEMPTPSFMTFDNMINNDLKDTIETIFSDINSYIFAKESVDLNHVYLDGTKLRANAGTYTWVWKKSCIKNRNKVFGQVTDLLQEVNDVVVLFQSAVFDQRQEYSVEYLDYVKSTFMQAVGMKERDFVHGSGKRKTVIQRLYEKLSDYRKRLKSYGKSIEICGEKRNSYSKTEPLPVKRTMKKYKTFVVSSLAAGHFLCSRGQRIFFKG